jgi:hypothetical protein
MPSFDGKFLYKSIHGAAEQSGSCRVTIDSQNLQILTEAVPALAFDLGDIDEYVPGEYELSLRLYDGSLVVLSHFGKTYQNLAHDLLESYRDRTVRCLLLEDLEEIMRVDGFVQFESEERHFEGRSELRLYRSNLAVLPERASGLQWRLADVDAVTFDESRYALDLRAGSERLVLSKLAKRTDDFRGALKSSMNSVSEQAARILQRLFPFLTPDQFQKVAALMKEGRAAAIPAMESIHPQIGKALIDRIVDAKLKPYFEYLQKQAVEELMYAGFKLIREEEEEDSAERQPDEVPGSQAEEPETASSGEEQPVLHWYFFPLRSRQESGGNIVAWEAVSRSGRATYFFRLSSKKDEAPGLMDTSIRSLNRALVLVNFRREPIYLGDESLQMQPRYRRYAIACRKIPVLRNLRAAFLGRALHTSFEEWELQVQKILAAASF